MTLSPPESNRRSPQHRSVLRSSRWLAAIGVCVGVGLASLLVADQPSGPLLAPATPGSPSSPITPTTPRFLSPPVRTGRSRSGERSLPVPPPTPPRQNDIPPSALPTANPMSSEVANGERSGPEFFYFQEARRFPELPLPGPPSSTPSFSPSASGPSAPADSAFSDSAFSDSLSTNAPTHYPALSNPALSNPALSNPALSNPALSSGSSSGPVLNMASGEPADAVAQTPAAELRDAAPDARYAASATLSPTPARSASAGPRATVWVPPTVAPRTHQGPVTLELPAKSPAAEPLILDEPTGDRATARLADSMDGAVAQREPQPTTSTTPPAAPASLPAPPLAQGPLAAMERPQLPEYTAQLPGGSQPVAYDPSVFSPTPRGEGIAYDPRLESSVYGGKYLVPTQRPWVELGRGLYLPGPIPPSETWLGENNLVSQHLLVYGDYRIGSAYNEQLGNEKTVLANRLNLDIDWKLTATERIHAFWGPLDQGNDISRFEYDQGEVHYFNGLDNDLDALFFEGDLGYLYGGATGQDAPFDLPFTVGRLPIFLQNGIWMEDAVTGAAATILARNAPSLGIANYDITFFIGFDDLNTAALANEEAGNVYGVHGFFDMWGGYLETGYGFVDDSAATGLSYHNVGISFTRRYFQRFSNSLRYISNFGQDPTAGRQTADGHLVLLETTLRTPRPHTMIPYVNLFAGFDRPQSLGRAAGSGGVLRNTGINFETDGLTGYPTLDATAQNTAGGAVGLNMLGPVFDYQLIMEFAWLHAMDNAQDSVAPGDQYGVGVRYQLPLTNAMLLRMDAMHGFLENADDITGARTEIRYKF